MSTLRLHVISWHNDMLKFKNYFDHNILIINGARATLTLIDLLFDSNSIIPVRIIVIPPFPIADVVGIELKYLYLLYLGKYNNIMEPQTFLVDDWVSMFSTSSEP